MNKKRKKQIQKLNSTKLQLKRLNSQTVDYDDNLQDKKSNDKLEDEIVQISNEE